METKHTGETPAVRILERAEYRSRKDYPCAVCGGTIKRREPHIRVVFIQDGKLQCERQHRACPDGEWNGVVAEKTD